MEPKKPARILLGLTAILLVASILLGISLVRQLRDNPILPPPTPAVVTVEPQPVDEEIPQEDVQGAATAQPVIQVKKVVDGDTFVLASGETVRLIGIDTPETVDPRRPVGCFGKEASDFAKQMLAGQTVRLEKDISETDKYDRLLRYVFIQTDQGEVFFDDLLVRQGYAVAKTYPPDVKYQAQFLQAQQEARENNRGLWGKCV